MQKVTVLVPASTSNLGPGFDCLGVALRLYNTVTVTRGAGGSPKEMMQAAAESFFAHAAQRPFAFACRIEGDVPQSRGLGSSVTLRLGLLHGLNVLSGRPLPRLDIFQLCVDLEGHPDNAAPAEFGGFNIVRPASRQRFAVAPALKFVLLVPDFEVSTARARALLPDTITRLDAVASCANACAIAAAFASGDYPALRGAFGDHLHQPFRKKLVPHFDEIVQAAAAAGALGAFLSGSGSTIAALTLQHPRRVGAAMQAAAGAAGRILIVAADNRGARILSRA